MLNLMHRTDHSKFRKRHDFVPDFSHAERRTRIVIGVTAAMMIVEIVAGLMSRSMALLADGWHMSTHVIAFLITAVAYYFARTQAGNARFSFGTGKIGVLGGFTSAVVHPPRDRKSTRLNSSHQIISYAVFCLKKKKKHSEQSCEVDRNVARYVRA